MIELTGINGNEMIINCDYIECIESIPDTKVTLTTGRKILVKDEPDEIMERIIEYKKQF